MSMISVEEINSIRSNVDIVDIISSYIPLSPRGKNFFGTCPFHDDHSPSMSVSKEKQIYTCFSCGATGNVFKFVMDYENVSFPESVNIVATKAGIPIHFDTTRARPVANKELYEIYDLSAKVYQNNINTPSGKEAREYLQSREISEEAIRKFGIGLANTNRKLITKLLEGKHYQITDMLKSGIIVEHNGEYVDIYYNRIMFPIWDTSGKVVGFSGRVFHGEKTAKYINTKETEIFKKGELLYNYHHAKEFARMEDTIIIMEGQLDVIRAYSVGIKNVIGTMGTAITKKHALLIKRLAKNVILCFDGDAAGAKATLACSRELEKIDVNPKIVRLEDGMDPDEYIRKNGKDAFIDKVMHPISLLDFKLSYYKRDKDFTNANDMGAYVRDMIRELTLIEDDIVKELTLQKMSSESGLELSFLKEQLEKSIEKQEPKKLVSVPKKVVSARKTKYEKAEMYLIYYMLQSREVIDMYDHKVTYLPTEKYRLLAREISYYYELYHEISAADFMTFISDDERLMETLGEIMALNLPERYNEEAIRDYIRVIGDYNIKTEMNRLKRLMNEEDSPMKKAEIASQIVALKVRGEEND